MAMRKRAYLGLIATLAIGACASGPTRFPEALSKVKTVGIVGFEIVQQEPKDFEISLGGSSSDESMGNMPTSKTPVAAKHAAQVYDVLRKALQKDLKWRVRDDESLRKNATYASITKEQTSGFRSLPPVGAEFDVYSDAGVMDYWAWEKLSASKRQQVAAQLKVDALLVVRATSVLKESFTFKKLYGGGNFHPQVSYEFKLYAANGSDVIWADRIQGEPTSEQAGHFAGISKRETLNKLVVKAAEMAAEKLKDSHNGKSK